MMRNQFAKLGGSVILACVVIAFCAATTPGTLFAQSHNHGGDDQVKAPKIFLDKSRRIIDFQLKRLNNQRLLLVERKDTDAKYLPVHEAILKRDGIAVGDRQKALAAIVKINDSGSVAEIMKVLQSLDQSSKADQRIAEQLTRLLLALEPSELAASSKAFSTFASSDNRLVRRSAFGGLLASGEQALATATQLASGDVDGRSSLLESIPLVTNQAIRNQIRPFILESLKQGNVNVKRRAIDAFRFVDSEARENFNLVAPFLENDKLRRSAVKMLAATKREDRSAETAAKIAKYMVAFAEKTPAKDRTSNAFLEAMQLTDQLLGLLSADTAKSYRKRLDEVVVRVILIHTVEEEMRYDLPWFAVQAGREFQVLLQNEDLMPHNLVFTKPGKLQEIALEGAALGPKIGASGKQYVPVSDDVVAATEMVAAESQTRLTFKAPTEPGEYPYVCTFPGHWMRMYGVMVVVDDLTAFQQNPVEPKDPVGSNRSFVKAWKVSDLEEKLQSGLRGRNKLIGEKIFQEATCATCHVVNGKGALIGPELTDVWKRWKGDAKGVLREILEPSHKIDAKYVTRQVLTLDGVVISGVVVKETDDSISLIPTPDAKEPTVVSKDDIDDTMESAVSLMPKALMDRFTEDEIFELMAYLKAVSEEAK